MITHLDFFFQYASQPNSNTSNVLIVGRNLLYGVYEGGWSASDNVAE